MDVPSEHLLRQVPKRGNPGVWGAAPGGAFLWVLSCRGKKVPRLPGRDRVNTSLSKIEAGTKQDPAAVVAIQTEAEIVF